MAISVNESEDWKVFEEWNVYRNRWKTCWETLDEEYKQETELWFQEGR